jgi:L-lactate utilization protein LutC
MAVIMSYSSLPTPDSIDRTIKAVEARGVSVVLVETNEAALAAVIGLIPDGAAVMTGASLTLKEIGFEELLKTGPHHWKNLKAELLAEKDPSRQSLLRKQATLADYFLGSVHAIAETGEIVVASASGSQLAPYAFSSSHVIWVAGAQKVVSTVDAALQRIREYILPHEHERMKKASGDKFGSYIGKILIFERESPHLRRSVTLVLVRQVVGD